jgi:predicted acyl esterase
MLDHSPLGHLGSLNVPVFWSNSWEDQLFPADHPQSILEALKGRSIPTHYWFASGGHEAGANDPADEIGKETAMLHWFDRFLRGVGILPNDPEFSHRVDYAERTLDGGWTHKTADDWPIPGTTPLVFHPHADGSLASDPDGENEQVGVVVNDLANPNLENDPIFKSQLLGRAPQLGAVLPAGPEPGTPLDTRIYTSAELGSDTEVVGSPTVELALSSTAVGRFQVSAKLYDVARDGSATMINRACTARAGEEPTLPLWPNAHVFPKDHRIALAISAVDFPTFEAEREPQATSILAATKLSLPVTPAITSAEVE